MVISQESRGDRRPASSVVPYTRMRMPATVRPSSSIAYFRADTEAAAMLSMRPVRIQKKFTCGRVSRS